MKDGTSIYDRFLRRLIGSFTRECFTGFTSGGRKCSRHCHASSVVAWRSIEPWLKTTARRSAMRHTKETEIMKKLLISTAIAIVAITGSAFARSEIPVTSAVWEVSDFPVLAAK